MNSYNSYKPIISISRRTDVPAFYSPWLKQRLREGWVEYLHPYSRRYFRLGLKPEDVSALVFWSKDYGPFFDVLPLLKSKLYSFYCHFTITGLPSDLEPKVPPLNTSLNSFKKLASETSPGRIQWRYDPIIISQELSFKHHLERFDFIATRLSGYTKRCIVSFVNRYKKIEGRLEGKGINVINPTLKEKIELLKELKKIGIRHNIDMYSCCDDAMLASGIKKARCIDPEILSDHCGVNTSPMAFSPTRKECGCLKSFDIGFYDTCAHECLYCYANSNIDRVRKNYKRHNPSAGSLIEVEDKYRTQKKQTPNLQRELFSA